MATGLILEGGGMRAGFVAGVLMALLDQGITEFDAAVAVSASVPTLAYFSAGQREEIEHVWRNELHSKKLVCYRNIPTATIALSRKRPFIDIDYLVYNVFKERYPLDTNAMNQNGMICRFAVTKVPEGSLVFLSPAENDIYESFRAALAVPGCYPSTVRIGDGEYVDGGVVDPLPIHGLWEMEVDRVLAVLSKPLSCESDPPNFLEKTLFWRYFHRYDWMLERLWEAAQAYNDCVISIERLAGEEPPCACIICPDDMPPARFITRDRRKINETVDVGYRAGREARQRIAEFLEYGKKNRLH